MDRNFYVPQENYLGQRLQAPLETGLADSWAFGGGRSGLSSKQSLLLGRIFRFDYMGNSDYEFGEVSRSLDAIVKYSSNKHNIVGEVDLEIPVYYYCHEQEKDKVENRLKYMYLCRDDCCGEEPTFFKSTLEGSLNFRRPENRIIGWLFMTDRANGNFIAFTEKERVEVFRNLFEGIKIKKGNK